MFRSHQLHFPNPSRSFQKTRATVQFWGSDQTIEVSFYVTAGALKHLQSNLVPTESGFLTAFDRNRDRIEAAALKAYRRGERSSYELDLADI
jgi:hypothetical protein